MKEIIRYLHEGNVGNIRRTSKSTFTSRCKLFKIMCERDIDLCSLSGKVRNKYLRENIDVINEIDSDYVLVYVLEYLVKYRLPDINHIKEVYGDQYICYMVMEALRINTSLGLRYRGLDKESIIAASRLDLSMFNVLGTCYTTSLNISTFLMNAGYKPDEILMTWEEQGICLPYEGLIVILIDVIRLISSIPRGLVPYMLKWGRNERLKGVKLI